jgi:hypothetical protein
MSSELFRRVLLAAAIEQNSISGTTSGLPLQPLKDIGLRIEEL